MIEPVIKSILVPCTPEKAFDVFVRNTGTWWPLESHSISSGKGETAVNVLIECKVGGDIYEISDTGERYNWGKVTVFAPAKKFAMTWHLSNPPSLGTLVMVTFSAHSNGGTEVVLQHDNWDNLSDGAKEKRDQYNSGWIKVFETNYADACQG